ncbi:hypothetical protein GQ600_696 [Phytophthora cactorum]|nr:hypothetical protein GQ600_696 [Phytophthora cactorum]
MCGAVNREDAGSEGQSSAASSPRSIKGSLSFILDEAPVASVQRAPLNWTNQPRRNAFAIGFR